MHASCCVFWVFVIPSFFISFLESSTLYPLFLIHYYQTNLHFYIPFGILLYFYITWFQTISRPHPSFAKRLILSIKFWAVFLFSWEFIVPSILCPLHEILSFLSFIQVYTYYSSFFFIHPFSFVNDTNIVVFCTSCCICRLLCHCYISIAAQWCWLKLIILIHISHKVFSLMHGSSVHLGFQLSR